jgi:hypothetical protein
MEMIVVIVLIGIVFSIGATLLGQIFTAYFTTRDIEDADWQGLIALERISRDLRELRTAADLNTTFPTANALSFTDRYGSLVEYSLNGTALVRSTDGTAYTLADSIGGLSFAYLQSDGQTAATGAANTSYITLRLQVTADNYSDTLRLTIQPRIY